MSVDIIDGASPPRVSDPAPGRPGWPGHRWRLGIGLGAAIALAAALIAAVFAGAYYQPVRFGGSFGPPYGPHLITTTQGNEYGLAGQTVLPAQPSAHGTVYVSLENAGPLPVTIESVSFNGPGVPANAVTGMPFTISGQSTYTPMFGRHGKPKPLAGAALRPGQYILIRIPIVTAPCWTRSGEHALVDSFWVTSRSLLWTHRERVSWTDPGSPTQGAIVSREGGRPSSIPGMFCPR
ncbi:MAG: hypothetical protein M0030_32805 [Actinomycetota bacterium]|nr:hypothetical protein [Actinomycetota bacterium]